MNNDVRKFYFSARCFPFYRCIIFLLIIVKWIEEGQEEYKQPRQASVATCERVPETLPESL